MVTFLGIETADMAELHSRGDAHARSGAVLVAVWLLPDGDVEIMASCNEDVAYQALYMAFCGWRHKPGMH